MTLREDEVLRERPTVTIDVLPRLQNSVENVTGTAHGTAEFILMVTRGVRPSLIFIPCERHVLKGIVHALLVSLRAVSRGQRR